MNVLVKKNDRVKVLTGKDRGKSGRVLFVDKSGKRVIVEGLNLAQFLQMAKDSSRTRKAASWISRRPCKFPMSWFYVQNVTNPHVSGRRRSRTRVVSGSAGSAVKYSIRCSDRRG